MLATINYTVNRNQIKITAELRQLTVPHEIAVTLTGRSAPLIEGPFHEALAATAVTGGKDTRGIQGTGIQWTSY